MNRIRYDYSYLQQFCNDNGIKLLENYSNFKVNRETKIKAICLKNDCNNTSEKTFRYMIDKGCYCIIHTKENMQQKSKETCLKNHGVKNPSQSEEIKNKKKETCLKNHGVEWSLQSKNIREKGEKTIIEKYGVKNAMQNQDIKNKTKETNLKNLGVEYPQQSKEVRKKTNESYINIWGVNHISQSEEIKNKKVETSLENWGVEYTQQSQEIKEKTKNTNKEKYGVEHTFQSEEIKEKIKNTNIEKYGVPYPQQNAEISEKTSKSSLNYKNYEFPSGRIERIQGYENFMLDDLLKNENICEDHIIVKRNDVPVCWYEDTTGKKCRYYVDCFITSQNRCIEVKSTWTLTKIDDCIFLKQKALKNQGYICEIWVYNSKGEKVDCYK